jgi:hypothetical protein
MLFSFAYIVSALPVAGNDFTQPPTSCATLVGSCSTTRCAAAPPPPPLATCRCRSLASCKCVVGALQWVLGALRCSQTKLGAHTRELYSGWAPHLCIGDAAV